jgi:hypothetical protein
VANAGPVTAGGFQFDLHGHVKSYTDTGSTIGVMSVNSPLDTIKAVTTNGSVTIDLPDMDWDEDLEVEALDSTLTVDLWGRVKAVAPKTPQVVTERMFAVFPPGGMSYSFSFPMTARGRLRLSLRGDLGSAATGWGLASPLPAGFAVTLDGLEAEVFADVIDGHVVGLEVFTTTAMEPGDRLFAFSLPFSLKGSAILDVSLCR